MSEFLRRVKMQRCRVVGLTSHHPYLYIFLFLSYERIIAYPTVSPNRCLYMTTRERQKENARNRVRVVKGNAARDRIFNF
jgi:hypothetical protein